MERSIECDWSPQTDYGVDLGLLIDAQFLGARILEADIGHLEHESQTLEALGDMAMHVARAAQHSLWGSLERLSWLLPELECAAAGRSA